MGTISELIGPLYYLYDQSKSFIEFSDKFILLMSIQCIFGLNKFLVPLPGILVSLW